MTLKVVSGFLSLMFVFVLQHGLRTGEFRRPPDVFKRDENPVAYWFLMGFTLFSFLIIWYGILFVEL